MGDAAHPKGDGCGAQLPIDGGVAPAYDCRTGTPSDGRDPATSQATAGRGIDQGSSSPTLAPDRSAIYGPYSRYDFPKRHTCNSSATPPLPPFLHSPWNSTPPH